MPPGCCVQGNARDAASHPAQTMPRESTLSERDDGRVAQINATSMKMRVVLIRMWTARRRFFNLGPRSAAYRWPTAIHMNRRIVDMAKRYCVLQDLFGAHGTEGTDRRLEKI